MQATSGQDSQKSETASVSTQSFIAKLRQRSSWFFALFILFVME
jgi:hypothetical protein